MSEKVNKMHKLERQIRVQLHRRSSMLVNFFHIWINGKTNSSCECKDVYIFQWLQMDQITIGNHSHLTLVLSQRFMVRTVGKSLTVNQCSRMLDNEWIRKLSYHKPLSVIVWRTHQLRSAPKNFGFEWIFFLLYVCCIWFSIPMFRFSVERIYQGREKFDFSHSSKSSLKHW